MQYSPQNFHSRDTHWSLWPIVPLYPYSQRQTLRQEVVKDSVWTFDQVQGIFYVVVPIRMTVVKLEEGGLLVYSPVAPTKECIRLVNELVEIYGEVKYIILPTISGIEHKVFVGPFARRFPQAQVYIAPGQWSYPLNLPLSWLGFPRKRTHILPQNSQEAPFGNQFDYSILGPLDLGLGRFAEVALLDKRSRTLLVTDSVVSIPENPPAIVELDPYPLLFHAKDSALDIVPDTIANRRKGWQRTTLFTFYFQPHALGVASGKEIIQNALKTSDRSKKAYFGLFPFSWQPGWQDSFYALRGGGRLLVAPVLRTLILNRAPQETLNWANQIARWDFIRIIPCHLDSPISTTPQQFRQAFGFLEKDYIANITTQLPKEDLKLLQDLDQGLQKLKVVPPAQDICPSN